MIVKALNCFSSGKFIKKCAVSGAPVSDHALRAEIRIGFSQIFNLKLEQKSTSTKSRRTDSGSDCVGPMRLSYKFESIRLNYKFGSIRLNYKFGPIRLNYKFRSINLQVRIDQFKSSDLFD